MQSLLHGNAPNLLVNDFNEGDTIALVFKLCSSKFSHASNSGYLVWMVWYSVNAPYDSDGSFEQYDTAMVLNFHVKYITCWNLKEPQVLGCTSMVDYGLSHQAHYCFCFSLVTGGCNSVMEFGIQMEAMCSFDILILAIHSSGDALSFLRIYLVKEESQKTQGICPQRDGECLDYSQWHVAWTLSISPTSKDKQYVIAGVSPHDCSLGVHYWGGDIFEGCKSARFSHVWLLYWNYSHLNLCTWYPAIHCTTALHTNYASDSPRIEDNEVLIT
jgi:hypothetical protein